METPVTGYEVMGLRVPGWLYGMPDDWWQEYFDKVDEFVISYRWGHC